jgi:hypothetical protein
MATATLERVKPQQTEATPLQARAAAVPTTREEFCWEEHAHAGDRFAFALWLIGYGTIAVLALLDWLAALLG